MYTVTATRPAKINRSDLMTCPGARALNGPDVIPVGHRGHGTGSRPMATNRCRTITDPGGPDWDTGRKGDSRRATVQKPSLYLTIYSFVFQF